MTIIALVWARLLLWTDPKRSASHRGSTGLPGIIISAIGAPANRIPETWPQNYQLAVTTVAAAALHTVRAVYHAQTGHADQQGRGRRHPGRPAGNEPVLDVRGASGSRSALGWPTR